MNCDARSHTLNTCSCMTAAMKMPHAENRHTHAHSVSAICYRSPSFSLTHKNHRVRRQTSIFPAHSHVWPSLFPWKPERQDTNERLCDCVTNPKRSPVPVCKAAWCANSYSSEVHSLTFNGWILEGILGYQHVRTDRLTRIKLTGDTLHK